MEVSMLDKGLFQWGRRTYVMGIINVTPDSFSGDGTLQKGEPLESAIAKARRFIQDGADILDIGGESTRPGSQPVTEEEELSRVIPVIRSIRGETRIPISIDTYKAEVARASLEAGADWINYVWGFRADPDLAAIAHHSNAPVVIMHNRSKPVEAHLQDRLGGRYIGSVYNDLIGDIRQELLDSVEIAHAAGIPDENIILDPGIGFGKTVEQNQTLINRLDQLKDLGYPLLLGPSRKSFIGYTLDLPPADRLEGTAAAVAIGIVRGADIIRVHDVMEMTRIARMCDAILKAHA
ncbi:MAG: dihydropteroate synthase [Anaerolineaceae bacterium]|nr:dihydropteroate synthase [Anaerolineaceae bacterium]